MIPPAYANAQPALPTSISPTAIHTLKPVSEYRNVSDWRCRSWEEGTRGPNFVPSFPIPRQAQVIPQMTKSELAEGLRSRLAQKCLRGELDGTLPSSRKSFLQNLERVSHDNLIGGFLRCSVCGRMSMSVEQAVRFAGCCETADEWTRFLVGWQQRFSGCLHDIEKPN